jgi:tol-pal system protein YbgF
MNFRPVLTGALALMLLSAGAASAEERGLLPKLGLPNLFGDKQRSEVQVAQSGDPRIMALEEEVRALSGRVEELNFQILQMQDQMRKMQEDNEFRFQELEKKSQAGGAPRATTSGQAAQQPAPGNRQAAAAPLPPAGQAAGEPATAPGPKTFGTITFDGSGNVTGGSVTEVPAASGGEGAAPGAASDGTIVAALPATDDPEEVYRNSYEFILSGDYGTAEAGFRDHIARFPGDAKTADARYWLGEALLGQKKYRDAAEVFLDANKQFPSARKAPDMLLKLGVSLTALDQRDVACATFQEVGKRYPDISAALKERVRQEQALAKC